jgi:RND family efflux transporter MFP subunit
VQQAKIGFEKAQRDNQRAGNLYRDSVATLEQYQNSKTALDLSQQQLNTATFNAQYSEIRARENGYILKKLVNDGQVIGPGTPAFQVNGAGNQDWVLKVAVSNKDWSNIEKGDQAFIIQSPAIKVPAKVVNKSEGTDPITGTMWVTLKPLTVMPEKIATGSFGKASIIPTKSTTGWMLPYDAVIDGNSNDGFVFITKDNKTAEKLNIKIGEITNNGVLVTSGLEGISAIIISGNAYLNEGTPIKIIK